MKTQISRNSFQPDKRYTGIHQQQGRMLTDADWNELVAICREQCKQMFTDVVGNGSPRTGSLFITSNRRIQPGDLYVDGLRAELAGALPFAANAQPDLPDYFALPVGPYLVYADVWERTVTSLEDANLRDPGLHGADTCTRTQTMVQIKTCPESVNPETTVPRQGSATLSLILHTSLEAGDPCDPCAGLISAGKGRVGSYLFRLEVHAVEGTATNPTRLILKWSSENGAEQYEALSVERMPPGFVTGDYVYEFHNLTTEKHLGVFLGTGFTPTHGTLRTSYAIPDTPPRELVRRWDGYCELTRSGARWSLVAGVDRDVALTTGGAATAPGHVALGTSLQINLEALQLVLDLSGKTFVAGDFWLAPVREAVDGPGSTVLSGAEPRGIEHHYLRLARVQADGSVVLYENDADQRRRRFPPLTDLRAHDVGYQTTCDSGLFEATHDNVEKALNRLCQLAAEHIAYTATCATGLYAGFSGTVKQALDRICAMQASHVGFTKSCDTSLYQGKDIATVDDVLKLLCDIRAGHIAYQPGGDCTFLDQPGINTVQDALDALCARPAGGEGGCRITVGKGGHYSTLEEAFKELLDRGEQDICLCLLPGDHLFPGQELKPQHDAVNLCLAGCGPATRLHVQDKPVHFIGFRTVCLGDMDISSMEGSAGALLFERCGDVSLQAMVVHGVLSEQVLVGIRNAGKVAMHNLVIEAAGPQSLVIPSRILDLQPALRELFRSVDRLEFNRRIPEVAESLVRLPVASRRPLVRAIEQRLQTSNEVLSAREIRSYRDLLALLGQTNSAAPEIIEVLGRMRREAIGQRPAERAALAIEDAEADWTLINCDILGVVTLYGREPEGSLPHEMVKHLDEFVDQGEVGFRDLGTTLRINGGCISRIDISTLMRQQLDQIADQGRGTVAGLFSSALLGELTLRRQDNQLIFGNTCLSATVFEGRPGNVALVMAGSSIYIGNRGEVETIIMNLTPRGRSERAANLGLVIST